MVVDFKQARLLQLGSALLLLGVACLASLLHLQVCAIATASDVAVDLFACHARYPPYFCDV